MLSKLLKYDLKSMFKIFIPLWLALIVVSLVNRFTINQPRYDAPQMLSMMLYVFLFAAVIIVALVLIVMRFYNGLLKDEGYLMFTLPVKPWQLITSKCLSAALIILISMVVGALSVCCIALSEQTWREAQQFFALIAMYMSGDMVVAIILSVLLMFAAIIASVTHVYTALALGHLAPSHRIGWAVGAFIGINILFTSIGLMLGRLMDSFNFNYDSNFASEYALYNLMVGILLGICVIQIVLFFFTTERILSKKLNLE